MVFNFIYSIPQLFRFVPCPRHRLPHFSVKSNTVGMSLVKFKIKDLHPIGKLSLNVLHFMGMLYSNTFERSGEIWQEINNLTLINVILKFTGPLHEERLTILILSIQVLCSFLAFFIRFGVALLLFDVVA
ncbi:unnamed protein product [Dracunculus medinensis]|uniref:UDP-N-acetylglucosamine--dolichyl-phosphate N-acetylglucosaminephosphotransferase n=1 Tax=Dracunculus medinensis TaxID=318479 RepID=A0A0N4UR62_DRAME|nr:unnamed protein product [Dracunculus medinensis]